MLFNIAVYIIVAITVLGGVFLLFSIYQKYIHRGIKKYIFHQYDDDENLPDEEKYRRYIEKKQREIIKQQQIARSSEDGVVEYKSSTQIVGIMEPIGRWTKFVMSEKLQRMAGLKFDEKHNGFWQMIIRMKGMSQGKYKGRGR